MKIYNTLKCFSLAGAMIVALSACTNTPEKEGSLAVNDEPQLEKNTEEYATTRLDKTERRVNELMITVRDRSDRLERWGEENMNISDDARLEKDRLARDLKRVEKKLQANLDTLEKVTEENLDKSQRAVESELEATEDELSQIEEELDEWHDVNSK